MAKAIFIGVPAGIFLIAILLLAVSALGTLTAQTAIQNAGAAQTAVAVLPALYQVDGVEVVEGEHGFDRHGAEYLLAVQACQGTGHKEWYLEPDKRTLHTLCEGPDGLVYDLVTVLKKGARQLYEKTAFKRADTWSAARSAMWRKDCTAIFFNTVLKMLGL